VNPGPLAIHGGVAPSIQIHDIGFRWLQTEKNAGWTNLSLRSFWLGMKSLC
jgi:hypothetical protein